MVSSVSTHQQAQEILFVASEDSYKPLPHSQTCALPSDRMSANVFSLAAIVLEKGVNEVFSNQFSIPGTWIHPTEVILHFKISPELPSFSFLFFLWLSIILGWGDKDWIGIFRRSHKNTKIIWKPAFQALLYTLVQLEITQKHNWNIKIA